MSELSESAFNQCADKIYEHILNTFEEIASTNDYDIEVEQNGNVLDITFPNQKKIIINTQRQWREIWLACPLGASHFALVDGRWFSSRDNIDLAALLSDWSSQLLSHQCEITIPF